RRGGRLGFGQSGWLRTLACIRCRPTGSLVRISTLSLCSRATIAPNRRARRRNSPVETTAPGCRGERHALRRRSPLMITLTFVAILVVALVAHYSGRSVASEPSGLARVLESRGIVVIVFVATFVVLWYSWAAWNPIPIVHDELAYVLQAQIFARGRWALPSPPFPLFWEQPH